MCCFSGLALIFFESLVFQFHGEQPTKKISTPKTVHDFFFKTKIFFQQIKSFLFSIQFFKKDPPPSI